MQAFAIHVNGEPDGTGFWVLAVDAGKGFLIARADKTFHWVAVDEATLLKAVNPEAPRPVVVVPSSGPKLVTPTNVRLNGAN